MVWRVEVEDVGGEERECVRGVWLCARATHGRHEMAPLDRYGFTDDKQEITNFTSLYVV